MAKQSSDTPEPVGAAATAAAVGLDLDDIKNGLRRLLPIIETVARLTPNKFDDAAVLFLKQVLAE